MVTGESQQTQQGIAVLGIRILTQKPEMKRARYRGPAPGWVVSRKDTRACTWTQPGIKTFLRSGPGLVLSGIFGLYLGLGSRVQLCFGSRADTVTAYISPKRSAPDDVR